MAFPAAGSTLCLVRDWLLPLLLDPLDGSVTHTRRRCAPRRRSHGWDASRRNKLLSRPRRHPTFRDTGERRAQTRRGRASATSGPTGRGSAPTACRRRSPPGSSSATGSRPVMRCATTSPRRERILDAGCGAGLATSTWLDAGVAARRRASSSALDISAAIDTARERLGEIEGTSFVQADILALPFPPGASTSSSPRGCSITRRRPRGPSRRSRGCSGQAARS